jgi:Zn-dependent protease
VCGALVHGDTLKQLAGQAEQASRAGNPVAARDHWQHALTLLPPDSQQFAAIQTRVDDLSRAIASDTIAAPLRRQSTWTQRVGGIGAVALLAFSKLKFLLLGLTKASTFISMFAFFGVYWSIYGWPLALGLVLGIYVHEMGHVAMLRRLGIAAGAPIFIPGVGALVMLKQRVTDPLTDAMIGLAGPVGGFAAALAAMLLYVVTGTRVFFVIAQLTAYLNLFNLIPVWQLDGARGFHVLDRSERWLVAGVLAIMLLLTEQWLLGIIGVVAIWRTVVTQPGPGDRRMLAVYAALIIALSGLAYGVTTAGAAGGVN